MTHSFKKVAASCRLVGLLAGSCILLSPGRPALATYEAEVLQDAPLSWWRFNEASGSTSFSDSGMVGLDLNDLNTGTGVVSGIASLPALGSAIDTTLGHVEAFDDSKGGQLALKSGFTYEAWQFLTIDEDASFLGVVGGNSVNPGFGTGTNDYYGTRMITSSGLGGPSGDTFRRLMSAGWTGTNLFGFEFPQDTPTKDLHYPLADTGAVPGTVKEEFSPVNGQWYYTAARFVETLDNQGNSQTQLFGDIYWQDDSSGTIYHRARDHGVEITPTRTPVAGLLGFAVGGRLGDGSYLYPGMIDEFAVYGTALSDERIEAHFMAGIEAPPAVAGDYNGNGVVDAADYVVWRDNLGHTGAPGIPGDGDDGSGTGTADGTVNQADYNFWKTRFGATSGAGSSATFAVPEPAGMALWAFGSLALASVRRSRGAAREYTICFRFFPLEKDNDISR